MPTKPELSTPPGLVYAGLGRFTVDAIPSDLRAWADKHGQAMFVYAIELAEREAHNQGDYITAAAIRALLNGEATNG